MGDLGLNPETALKLIQMVLRGAAYFLAGFAPVGFSAYVVFLCSELLSPLPRAKAKLAKVPQSVEGAPVLEQGYLSPVATPTLVEAVSLSVRSSCRRKRGYFPDKNSSFDSCGAEDAESVQNNLREDKTTVRPLEFPQSKRKFDIGAPP